MWHVLSPRQVTVDRSSRVTLQSLPPSQMTLLSTPVESVQSLVPAQLEVQLELQLPLQVDIPSHVLVQPVPQLRLHWFCESQR